MSRMEFVEIQAEAAKAFARYVVAQRKVDAYEHRILGQQGGHEVVAGDILGRDPVYKSLCGRRNGHQDTFRNYAQMTALMLSRPSAFDIILPDH